MTGTFPPDYFSPDFFAADYFGAEADGNAMVAAITGTSSVTATISVAAADDQDYDSHWHYARVKKQQRRPKPDPLPKPKPPKRVRGVLRARIVGTSEVAAVGRAFRTGWPSPLIAIINGRSEVDASISSIDWVEEQLWQDLEDMVDLYVLMAA